MAQDAVYSDGRLAIYCSLAVFPEKPIEKHGLPHFANPVPTYPGLTGGACGASAPSSPQARDHLYRGPFGKVVIEF